MQEFKNCSKCDHSINLHHELESNDMTSIECTYIIHVSGNGKSKKTCGCKINICDYDEQII